MDKLSGNKTDRENRIENNLGLVHSCANRFKGRGVEYDDLFQAGCLGLIKAADNFNQELGFSFSTYAVPVILGEIRRIFRDGGTVKVSRRLKENSRKASLVREELSKQLDREPTIGELAERLGVSPETAAEYISASLPAVSLTVFDDDKSGQFDIPVESHEAQVSDVIALREVLETLNENDRRLIMLRYFSGLTQTVTAAKLGMTQVQVSRREKIILSQILQKMSA